MKGAFVAAWLTGEAIVIWRIVHRTHRPPPPGELFGISALFLGLGLVAEYQPAAGLATAVAWGLDVAALFSALPAGLGGQITRSEQVSAQATGSAPQSASIVSPAGPAIV